jgi:hypothetical protein
MQQMRQSLSRAIAITAVAGMLLSPLMVSQAMAQIASCSVFPDSQSCVAHVGYPGNCTWNATTSVCVPELSDYLAIAFIVVTSGMVYYFRRGALARMKPETAATE